MAIPTEREQPFRERFPQYVRTLDCVHCGLCIQHCPTHAATGREASSPRGRIYLLRGYAEGTVELTPAVRKHLDECIVCRACESACPSGIRMGEMMEAFRGEMERQRDSRSLLYRISMLLLRRVLPHRRRVAWLSNILWLYQATRLQVAVRALLKLTSRRLAELERLQPRLPRPSERKVPTDRELPEKLYPAFGKPRLRAALFLGCIASDWFARTHRATIRVLQRNGCDVLVPDAQTCCGALHRHAGLLDEAEDLFRRNREVFRECGADVVVVNAAGCGAALKEPPAAFPDGLGIPVRDICELLDEIGIVPPIGRIDRRVVYDQPCHLLHGQRIGAEVVEGLLRQIPGIDLRPLRDSDRCCGSGGVYNVVHADLADPIGREKAACIREADPEIVVTGNPGCALQIQALLDGAPIEVLHPVELLDRSYGRSL
ncbi:MAG: (Fe-S)-binding protein [Planctomycetes bacterium]|nr:(Fe-S)-binding protein [Planctomycetota bacterium]